MLFIEIQKKLFDALLGSHRRNHGKKQFSNLNKK